MQTRFLGLALVGLLLAGCAAEWDESRRAMPGAAATAARQDAGLVRRVTAASFASLPDHGDLVAYGSKREVKKASAYTWHRVDLSERHALGAIATGTMTITAPNGRPIRLRYVRHIEHANGNWTWIGRVPGSKPGQEAILTFGEKAAFGSIPNGDEEPLRLTTAGGRAWLMETDREAIARMDNPATKPRTPDYLLPPELGDGAVPAGATPSASTASAAATPANTVDVLVGYTNGFASRLGGQSQAVTRITYLVDVTNQAYANSQVDAQVRLVHAMQVTYSDATANKTALHELTGVECTEEPRSCTDVGYPVSLQPLVAARDQYGADLVSLVRAFNYPENDGCGIAWLIGGSQSDFDTRRARSGMSVVSDSNGTGGSGSFPDDGYVCRDETFAHELGHNMGSQHDQDTANGEDNVLQDDEYGRYPYSFGHKTTSGAGNFYTVMAYGDSGQTKYRVFSNPMITYCGGYPCGIADQADNARSLRQTIPIIATFRATVVPVPVPPAALPPLYDARRVDVDADGKADLLWRNDVATHMAYWRLNGSTLAGSGSFLRAASWHVLASGDFTGDGRVDIIWSNGQLMELWNGNGTSFANQAIGAYPTGWQVVGIGDINGDGRADLFWRHDSGLHAAYWLMNGSAVVGSWSSAASPDWRVIATGDLNADNRLDILWTNGTAMVLWAGNGNGFAGLAMPAYPAGWNLAGVGDLNADGRTDLLWRNQAKTHMAYWAMQDTQVLYSNSFEVGPAWRIVASGDFSGDGRLDLAWTNESAMVMWLGNGSTFAGASMPSYPVGWSAANR